MNCVFLSLKDFVTEADFHCVAFFVYVFFLTSLCQGRGGCSTKKLYFLFTCKRPHSTPVVDSICTRMRARSPEPRG